MAEPLVLTREQRRWCVERQIGLGFDDDDPDLHQFSHLVEPTGERASGFEVQVALCRSPRLWFSGILENVDDGTPTWAYTLDCPDCIRLFSERYRQEP